MPSDAKLGLVVGVALVVAIAAVFFRRDEAPANARIDTAMAENDSSAPVIQRTTRAICRDAVTAIGACRASGAHAQRGGVPAHALTPHQAGSQAVPARRRGLPSA